MNHRFQSHTLFTHTAVASTLIGIALLTASCALLVPASIRFTPAELEAKLVERLPLRRTFLSLFDVELDRPKIGLDATEGRISAGFDLGLRSALSARVLNGTVRFSGTPRYDAATRSIVLDRARIEQLDLVGLPQGMRDRLVDVATLVAKDVLEQRPLYTLKPEQLRWAGTPMAPRGIRIADDRLVIDLARAETDVK
jgi:Protein of unknown function (DUF1439)